MSERRQSAIREPRAWETVIGKFNISDRKVIGDDKV